MKEVMAHSGDGASSSSITSPAAHPLSLWDCICEETDNGKYTTLRHAELGIAVELWHESLGAFHLYVPATGTEQKNAAGAVFCCFSSGIVVMEDAVCAPELLLKLCKRSVSFAAPGQGTLPPGSVEIQSRIWNSKAERTWSIDVDGVSRLTGHESSNTIVISHALTRSEIVLFYGGLIFAADETLLPTMSGLDASRQVVSLGEVIRDDGGNNDVVAMLMQVSRSAPSDPVHLRGADKPKGFSISSSWLGSDPYAPAPDAIIRRRVSYHSFSAAQSRQRFQRHREQQPKPAGPLPPRFCGASARFGKHEGLISVSGYQQQPLGPEVPAGLPLLPGRDGGGRNFMRPFLERTHLCTDRGGEKLLGAVEQAGGRELTWCRDTATKFGSTDDDIRDLLMTIARNGWAQFFDAESPLRRDAGKRNAVACLLNDFDDFGSTPLMMAAFRGHHDLAVKLLELGADPNVRDDRGRTCLFHALSPPPKASHDASGHTGTGYGSEDGLQGRRYVAASLVAILLDSDAHPDLSDRKGITPLRLAATCGYLECASLLMKGGADPNKADVAGASVIQAVEAMRYQATTLRQVSLLEHMLGLLRGSLSAPAGRPNLGLVQGAHKKGAALDYLTWWGPGASGNRVAARALALMPRRAKPRGAGESVVRTVSDQDKELAREEDGEEEGTLYGDGQGALCILAVGGRGAQGVRWMAKAVACKAVTAIGSLRSRTVSRGSRDSQSRLEMHTEGGRENEGGEERKMGEEGDVPDLARARAANPQLAAAAAIVEAENEPPKAAARASEMSHFLSRQFLDAMALKPGDVVRVLVADQRPGQEYHLEEGVVLDSWVENDRRRFLLRAATAADTRQGSNDEEKSDQDWNRKEGSQAWVDLHAGGTAGSTMTVPAHMLMEAWQAGTWKDLALPVPACGISLFTNAGRALLEAAQVERSSVFATVASAFRKQGTATSCGICCAVIALNAIKFVRAPSGGVALLSTGTSPRKHSRGAATAGLEVGGGMMVESEVRGRCSQLVPRADPDVLERHGLTLRQVAALCKALSAGAGEVSTYTCDHGHTICHLRHACRTRLASSAGASLSVIIANMYMGDVAKGGLGSVFPGMCWRLSSFSLRVFEMGHFAIIAAYSSGSPSGHTPSLSSSSPVGREEMVLVMDVWTQACDAYWVPLERAWAAMCTGKDEAWGMGNISKMSRGFLLVSVPLPGGVERSAPTALQGNSELPDLDESWYMPLHSDSIYATRYARGNSKPHA